MTMQNPGSTKSHSAGWFALATLIGPLALTGTLARADQTVEAATAALLESVQTARGLANGTIKGSSSGGGNNGGGTVTAEAFFASDVHDLIYPKCYSACHQENGSAPGLGARLVFAGPGSNQVDLNYQELSNYIVNVADGPFLLEKISNSNPLSPHTGGEVYSVGSDEYQTIQAFTNYFQ